MEAMKVKDEHFSKIDKHFGISEYQNKTDMRIEQMLNRLDNHYSMMKFGFEQMEKRFEQIDKRFEQIDKRFEQVDKRFDQIDKRFEQVDRRFEQMQHNMDKRFEQVDKRIDQLAHFFRWQTGISVTFFVMILGKLMVG